MGTYHIYKKEFLIKTDIYIYIRILYPYVYTRVFVLLGSIKK